MSKLKRQSSEGVSSSVYNAVHDPLHTVRLDKVMLPALKELSPTPQFVQLWNADGELPLVNTTFGQVPHGSLLSYQLSDHSPVGHEDIIHIQDAPAPEPFELPEIKNYFYFPLNYNLDCAYFGLEVSHQQAIDFESETKQQSSNKKWHCLREKRLTASKFKRICARKADFSSLANSLKSAKNIQTKQMLHGLEQEPFAAKQYADMHGRNVYMVGFVINPSGFHLGCSPDRRVYDPDAQPVFGLLEIKCPSVETIADCKYLTVSNEGRFQLKKTHEYYFQVMGQMGLTGSKWCDFFVHAKHEYHCERILYDDDFFQRMKEKLDLFYFNFLLTHFA